MNEPLTRAELTELAASIDHLSGPNAWDDDLLEPMLIPVTHYVPRLLAELERLCVVNDLLRVEVANAAPDHDALADDAIAAREELEQLRADLSDVTEQARAELAELHGNRVREVRAAFAAGWLEHAVAVANAYATLGFEVRETAGQAYTATRIADWYADGDATDATAPGTAHSAPLAAPQGERGHREGSNASTSPETPFATGGVITPEQAAAFAADFAANNSGCVIYPSVLSADHGQPEVRDPSAWCWKPNPNGPLPCGRLANHDGKHKRGEREWD